MTHKLLVEAVSNAAAPVTEKFGLILWDVEYVKEAGQYYLRVSIDRESGVFIEDCEKVSRALEPLLDNLDINDSYILEVSSAGLERRLNRERDFLMFMGGPVLVRLYKARDGIKEYSGILSGYDSHTGDVTVTAGDREHVFTQAEISIIRLRFEM